MIIRIVTIAILITLGQAAQAQLCGELFRSTPALDRVLSGPFPDSFGRNTTGPIEARFLRAVQSDVLGLDGFSDRARYALTRAFSLLNLNHARNDDLLVELHRRRYEQMATELGFLARPETLSRLRKNKMYLSLTFSAAANGAVNLLSYQFLGMFGFLIHIPKAHVFDARTLPNEVLNELIDAKENEETPKTRAFVASKVRYGVDTVVQAGRRMFSFGVLAVLLVAHADLITDPSGATNRMIDSTTSQVYEAAAEQNRLTLLLVRSKREQFLASGENEKVLQADQLILEIKKSMRKKKR